MALAVIAVVATIVRYFRADAYLVVSILPFTSRIARKQPDAAVRMDDPALVDKYRLVVRSKLAEKGG